MGVLPHTSHLDRFHAQAACLLGLFHRTPRFPTVRRHPQGRGVTVVHCRPRSPLVRACLASKDSSQILGAFASCNVLLTRLCTIQRRPSRSLVETSIALIVVLFLSVSMNQDVVLCLLFVDFQDSATSLDTCKGCGASPLLACIFMLMHTRLAQHIFKVTNHSFSHMHMHTCMHRLLQNTVWPPFHEIELHIVKFTCHLPTPTKPDQTHVPINTYMFNANGMQKKARHGGNGPSWSQQHVTAAQTSLKL
jgi:hypothetical protein